MGRLAVDGGGLMATGARRVLSTDPNAGTPVPRRRVLSADPQAGTPVTTPTPTEAPGAVSRFLTRAREFSGLPEQLSDVVEGPLYALQNPGDAAGLILGAIKDAHAGQFQQAGEQFSKAMAADTSLLERLKSLYSGAGFTAAGLVPVIGPAISNAEALAEQGDVAGSAGAFTGIVAGAVAPKVAAQVSGVKVVPGLKSGHNPAEAAAVQFAEQRGIPMDGGTATGRPIVRNIEKRVENSMGGATTADNLRAAQTDAMRRVSGELAGETNATRTGRPGAPQDTISAGEAVTKRLESHINAHARVADSAYGQLRALEQQQGQRIAATGGVRGPATSAQPFTQVPLAVDVAASKASLRPLYEALGRKRELAGMLMGDEARAYVALDGLMSGPDQVPLSVADAVLGDLKTMARTDDLPALRSQGQAVAAQTVKALDAQVTAAARAAGPQVVTLLERGRQATRAKHDVAAVRELLTQINEPGQVVKQLTRADDLGLDRLRQVARLAPREMPKIARAVVTDLMEFAKREGGFGHGKQLWNEWNRLGDKTKAILFRDPAHRAALDNFFLLAKKLEERPNPSGTSYALSVFNVSSAPPMWALSKLLHTSGGVRLLTRGLTLPTGDTPAVAAWTNQVMSLAGRERDVLGARRPVPATADRQSEDTRQVASR
jgi:hypothetical protein